MQREPLLGGKRTGSRYELAFKQLAERFLGIVGGVGNCPLKQEDMYVSVMSARLGRETEWYREGRPSSLIGDEGLLFC